jgi:hypothetical protein
VSVPALPSWLTVPAREGPAREGPAREVDGAAARSRAGLLRTWSRELGLPSHVSQTWDGFADALLDLAWSGGPERPEPRGLVIRVRDAAQVLADEPAGELARLARVLDDVAWAGGTGWPRPPVPALRMELDALPDELRHRLAAACPVEH